MDMIETFCKEQVDFRILTFNLHLHTSHAYIINESIFYYKKTVK